MMEDGNAAAERRRDLAETHAEADYDTFAPEIIKDFIDRICDGEAVKIGRGREISLLEFIEEDGVEAWIDPEDAANLLTGTLTTVQGIQDRARRRIKDRASRWLDTPRGQEWLSDQIRAAKEERE